MAVSRIHLSGVLRGGSADPIPDSKPVKAMPLSQPQLQPTEPARSATRHAGPAGGDAQALGASVDAVTLAANPLAPTVVDAKPLDGTRSNADPFNADTFDALVQQHRDRLHQLAFRLLGWDESAGAEDIVQDVFIALWMHRRRLHLDHGDASLHAWLNRAVVRRCLTARRARRRRRKHQTQAAIEATRTSASQSASLASNPTTAPITEQEAQHHRQRALQHALQQLRPEDRHLLVLHHLQSWSVATIAEAMKLKPNTCHQRLTRARQRLAAILTSENSEFTP